MSRQRVRAAGPALVAALASFAPPPATAKVASAADLAQVCRRLGNDDRVRPYAPSLRERTAQAFRTLFPDASGEPDPTSFSTQANYRCMSGKVLVCFIGANLPCAKIDMARANPGADAFCRDNPGSDVVPLVATGHDAGYSYRCGNGRAEITGKAWQLDARGFAKKLWTPLPER